MSCALSQSIRSQIVARNGSLLVGIDAVSTRASPKPEWTAAKGRNIQFSYAIITRSVARVLNGREAIGAGFTLH